MDDDGNSDWEDVGTYSPVYWDRGLKTYQVWRSGRTRGEIFIDIPIPSRYRSGQVYRVRSSTFSPAFLRSYRAQWELDDVGRFLYMDCESLLQFKPLTIR